MEDIPDALLGKIMVLADYGAAAGEPTCPAARFACVSQRWNRVYSRAHFETNELKRITSWSIQDLSEMRDGSQGSVETIVDSWVRPLGHLSPNWWTSAYVFSTNGREWLGDPVRDAQGGPFGVRPGHAIPHLRITFQEPVSVRAIALEARNRPRRLWLRSDQGTELLVEMPPWIGPNEACRVSTCQRRSTWSWWPKNSPKDLLPPLWSCPGTRPFRSSCRDQCSAKVHWISVFLKATKWAGLASIAWHCWNEK